MLDPNVPDFARGDWNLHLALDALDQLDEILHGLLAAVDGFVADDQPIDILVFLGKLDRRAQFTLIAVLMFINPRPHRDLQVEFVGDRRNEFDASS
jgi:hypothetical protein